MTRFARRSWGWYLTLIDRKHFKVKLLRFRKGQACSLQYHEERSELWLFLKGKGKFTRGTSLRDTGENEWQIVPQGVSHRYLAVLPTLVLEIQYGDKCDERDIIRA